MLISTPFNTQGGKKSMLREKNDFASLGKGVIKNGKEKAKNL